MAASKGIKMVEIVSIHIPKTAGSSFFRLLKKVYGRDSVLRLNTLYMTDEQVVERNIHPDNPDLRNVIHGHIKISQLSAIIEGNKPKIICWLRDPVERVISNYYFSMERVMEGKAREHKNETRDYSLLEYASLDENRNRACMLLDNIDPEDIFFIGFHEQYEDDISILGEKLDWPMFIDIPHQKDGSDFKETNTCKTQYEDITDEMRAEIADLNDLDVTLYEKAKAIRAKA